MALQLSFDDKFGSTHPSAYHRVTRIQMEIGIRSALVEVSTYVDAAARNADKEPVGKTKYRFNDTEYDDLFDDTNMSPVDKNPISNIYDHLKTLPAWAGSSDV
jgi:hypothetical protein